MHLTLDYIEEVILSLDAIVILAFINNLCVVHLFSISTYQIKQG